MSERSVESVKTLRHALSPNDLPCGAESPRMDEGNRTSGEPGWGPSTQEPSTNELETMARDLAGDRILMEIREELLGENRGRVRWTPRRRGNISHHPARIIGPDLDGCFPGIKWILPKRGRRALDQGLG